MGKIINFSNQSNEEIKCLTKHVDQIESKVLSALGCSELDPKKVYELPVEFLGALQRYLDSYWSELNHDQNEEKFQIYSDLLVSLTMCSEDGSMIFIKLGLVNCGDAT